jgi:hypothetical protein
MTVLITTTTQEETGLVVLNGATEPTNTVAVTSVPKSFFDPLILSMLRDHFASYGDINQWVPLQGFGRIIIVYERDESAEMAKLKSDPIVVDGHGGYVCSRTSYIFLVAYVNYFPFVGTTLSYAYTARIPTL